MEKPLNGESKVFNFNDEEYEEDDEGFLEDFFKDE